MVASSGLSATLRDYASSGQFVFVDPDRDLVVAVWSAQPKPTGREGVNEYAFLEALPSCFDNQVVVSEFSARVW